VSITAYFIINPLGAKCRRPLSGFTQFKDYVRSLIRNKKKIIIVKLVNGVVTKIETAEYQHFGLFNVGLESDDPFSPNAMK
jgi:hypothetical protein